jgi:hypothetical protein
MLPEINMPGRVRPARRDAEIAVSSPVTAVYQFQLWPRLSPSLSYGMVVASLRTHSSLSRLADRWSLRPPGLQRSALFSATSSEIEFRSRSSFLAARSFPMHTHDLARLAAVVAVHGQQLSASEPDTMDQMLVVYWRASRCRLDRWCHSLHALSEHSQLHPLPELHSGESAAQPMEAGPRPWSTGANAVVEEILVSEILTRTMAALTAAHDERHSLAESAPIGRNIFDGHLDARRRALALVASPAHRGTGHARAIVSLHRQCDRWTDLLLAYLAPFTDVERFAASAARVRDFEYDARHHLQSAIASSVAVTMILAGMNSSLRRLSPDRSPNTDLNLEIGTAILSSFSPETFDSFGLLRSNWLEGLTDAPDETKWQHVDWWPDSPIAASSRQVTRWRL